MNKYRKIFKISLYDGAKPEAFKKYRVWDGIGFMYFDTKKECNTYVDVRSRQLKRLYEESRDIFKHLMQSYVDRVIAFRVRQDRNHEIKSSIQCIVDAYSYMCKEHMHADYMPSKLLYVYDEFLNIANYLCLLMYHKHIQSLRDGFTLEYPDLYTKYCIKQREIKAFMRKAKNDKKKFFRVGKYCLTTIDTNEKHTLMN